MRKLSWHMPALLDGGLQLLYFSLLLLAPNWVTLPFVLFAFFRVTWYVLVIPCLQDLLNLISKKQFECCISINMQHGSQML